MGGFCSICKEYVSIFHECDEFDLDEYLAREKAVSEAFDWYDKVKEAKNRRK